MQPTSPNSVSQMDTVVGNNAVGNNAVGNIEIMRLYTASGTYEDVLVYMGPVHTLRVPRFRHSVIYPENQQGTDPDIILNHLDPREPQTLPRQ